MDDFELLQAYSRQHVEEAFITLVRRYLNLVYSSALRQTRDPHTAEDVTQVVFIILARKAAKLARNVILPGWLLRTTYYTALDARRREQRRQNLERNAMDNHNMTDPEIESIWDDIAPCLDQALFKLGDKDRNAVVLRFFEQKSFKEIGQTMGLSENTARMRVTRAIGRLRKVLAKSGVLVSVGTLMVALSESAVHAAPPGMFASVTAVAAAKGACATGTTAALLKEALEILAWSKVKHSLIVGILPGLLLVGTGVFLAPTFYRQNLLQNGDFELGLSHWSGYADPRSAARALFVVELTEGADGRAAKISVTQSDYYNSVELQQSGIPVQEGHKYRLSFRARSTIAQPLRVSIIKSSSPWTPYGFRVVTEITPRWRTYRLTSHSMVTASDGKLLVQCGGLIGDIWIDDIRFQDCGRSF